MITLFPPNCISNLRTVAVVCRANEVRSRVVEAYFKRMLNGCDVRSYGTTVNRNSKVNSDFAATMSDWGLDLTSHRPRHIESELNFINSADLVIAADAEVFSHVKGINFNCVNLTDFALDKNHVPLDPVGLPRSEFLVNVSKVVHCTTRLLNYLIPSSASRYEILAVNPKSPLHVLSPNQEAFTIDSTFRRSVHLDQSGLNVCWFDESDIRTGNILNLVNKNLLLYSSKFEFSKPEQVLISRSWSNFVNEVASIGPTEVITQPLGHKGSELWQPYLASSIVDKVKYEL